MGSKPSRAKGGRETEPTRPLDDQDSTMPFFRKQSGEAKKRLQHQLYLARESPDATFDLSKCEISEVPSGVFSLCKVLQKDTLLLHDNWMSQIKGGGNLKDLSSVRVLDLHDNELTNLPDDIGQLRGLQVLNLENNKLKHLPRGIDQLQSLQTLNMSGNKLKALPDCICTLRNLRTLNLANNPLTAVPRDLCQVRALETIVLNSDQMTYPPPNVCEQGTEAIMKYLCEECGIEYIPPSVYAASVLANSTPSDETTVHRDHSDNTIKKQQDMMRLEAQMEEEQRLQAQLAAQAAYNKQHLLSFVVEDQKRLDDGLNALQVQKDSEHQKLIDSLAETQQMVSDHVQELLYMNEKAKKMEELLEQMEQERIEKEQWFVVRQEENENLRKKEVLANMEKILEEYHQFNTLIEGYLAGRDEHVRRVQETKNDVDDKLGVVLESKKGDQEALILELIHEERLQKEAFEALQLQKDIKHQRLTGQIELIEQELMQLSMLEVEQKNLRTALHMDILEEKRYALTELLIQLLSERDQRVVELKKRLGEMEEQRQANQQDYWLIQYQRLMDRKPPSLIDQERQLEYAVIHILEHAGANDYIPVFARHRITIETLCQITDEELKHLGMYETGLRKAILNEVEKYKQLMEEERAMAKKKGIEDSDRWMVRPPAAEEPLPRLIPTAPDSPPCKPEDQPKQPTAPPIPSREVHARGLNTECVVCMEHESVVLFLNCGHVCTCPICSEPLTQCPLCRSDIQQRIHLTLRD